jgi:hypothetical protein
VLACWDCGFESRWGHGCRCLVCVVCCKVEVSVLGRSLVQRSHTEYDESECDRKVSIKRKRWRSRGCCAMKEKLVVIKRVLKESELPSNKSENYFKGR